MAAVENDGVQQVFDSSSSNKDVAMSSPLRNDFTFLCNGLDSFLENLKSDSDLSQGPEFRSYIGACADGTDPGDRDRPGVPPLPTKRPRTSVVPRTSNLTKVTLKDYDCPKPLIFFNRTIPVTQCHKFTRSISFAQQCPASSVDSLSECRFPPKLRSLYNEIKPDPEPAPTPIKTRRRRQRNRLSLSDHAFDNDDAHGRRNLLPTNEDLRTTYDKICNYGGIPYIFNCSRGKSCECPSKCAQQVNSFSLFMEINPHPGTPLHPLVRENIDCVAKESCIVDELSALVAVTAVQAPKMPLNRLFIPVSFHLKDKISCLKGLTPETYPEIKIEEPVRGVVNDLLDFVDRQLSFNIKDDYDPDFLATPENSFNEESQEPQPECTSDSPEQRKKRGKCKEQNKVLRELKKLMNISVTDETQEVTKVDDVKCSESSCSLGCVCSSVHEKYHPPPEHCGNIDCMFECLCSEESRDKYLNLGDLSKEEKSWHQTVIRKRNNALEIKSGVDRSKRRKKVPSRYDNAFTGPMIERCLGLKLRGERKSVEIKDYRAPLLPKSTKPSTVVLEKPKNPCVYVQKNSHKSPFDEDDYDANQYSEAEKVRFDKIRNALKKNYRNRVEANNNRRLRLISTERATSLYDVLIWCIVHNKFDCYCMNWVVFGRNNNLVCKPTCFRRFTVDKYLDSVKLEPNDADNYRQVMLYDETKHCARTAGSLTDYTRRNKEPLFEEKSSLLLKNKITSFSNGFVKVKPVATFTSQVPSDNYPFVPAIARKITHGVGVVLKITKPDDSDLIVDVGEATSPPVMFLPPDDLKWESSEDEIVDKSDFLLDDDSSEFIPKPKKRRLVSSPTQSFCFSSVMNKTKSTLKIPSRRRQDYDSDIELVEAPIETYSLSSSSSPEPAIVDGGTLSDSSVEDDMISSRNDSSSPKIFGNVTNYEDDCDQLSNPNKLVNDQSVGSSATSIKVLGSRRSFEICDQQPEKKSREKTSSSAPGLKVDQVQNTTTDGRENMQSPVVEEEGYPQKGLFCMSLPHLGYVKVKDSRPGNFIMEDPCEPNAFKIFKSCKEGSDYMKKLVGLCVKPEFACSEWVMVTRGVLEKYQSKPFDNTSLSQKNQVLFIDEEPPKMNHEKPTTKKRIAVKSRKDTDVTQKSVNFGTKSTAQGQERSIGPMGSEKQITKPFDLKVLQNSSNPAEDRNSDLFQESHLLMTGQGLAVPEKRNTTSENTAMPVSSDPSLARRKLVGTFPNISEANSFIEKNFQLYMRPSQPASITPGQCPGLTTCTPQVAGTARHISGKLVRIGSPVLTGPRVRGGVTHGKTFRTVLVRGALPRHIPPVMHIRSLPALKVSGAIVQSPTVNSIVSTTNAGISKTLVDTTSSSTYPKAAEATQFSVKTTDAGEIPSASKTIVIGSNHTVIPLAPAFPLRSTSKGTILISGLPKTTIAKQAVNSTTAASGYSDSKVEAHVNKGDESDSINSSDSTGTLAQNDSTSRLIESSSPPGNQVETTASNSVSSVQDDNTVDSSSAESSSDVSNLPKLPGTFVIESFSTCTSPMTPLPSTAVRLCRPILPKPVIPKVPPRRADVIIPRNDDFATLISPAPSETPVSVKVTTPDTKVFNGVLLPKSDKKDAKVAYICRKKSSSSNFRSLLQKR